MEFTRRDLGKIALASAPLSGAFGAKRIDSKFGGVQIDQSGANHGVASDVSEGSDRLHEGGSVEPLGGGPLAEG